ncbi:hypothetical protein MBLNU459_g0835t1 [Dothideomycetes sp. NU459]
MARPETLPYWLVNVPPHQQPATCPDFLLTVNDKDRGILATPDSAYRRLTWPEVKDIVRTNRIELFKRVPSDLRRYLGYTAKLKKDYGSVMHFVMNERLKWTGLVQTGSRFSDSVNLKVLYNDWPYGIDERIVHLVVWTKFGFDVEPVTGDLVPEAREEINDYVMATFCSRVRAENVIWFKNWGSLRSIQAIEHFHVMLFDPDMSFVRDITNNDVPLAEKIGVTDDV